MFIGALFLAVPLAAQGLMNSLASGIYNQPILALGLVVLAGLFLAGILRILQLQLVETVQQKIFAHAAIDITKRLLGSDETAFQHRYAPEVINRFFDVVTIQKSVAKLLLDGPASLLQIFLGMLLISFYSQWFLLFNLTFIIGLVVIVLLGKQGYAYSVKESAKKYRVAQWLEEIGLNRVSLKMNGAPATLVQKTDGLLQEYLNARQAHFKVVLRQFGASFFFEAIATTGVLIIGGLLVMNNQLTLGQLIASEIVILVVLSAADKLAQYLESAYDLLTSVDKLEYVLSLTQEDDHGQATLPKQQGIRVECDKVYFGYIPHQPIIHGISLTLEPQTHTSIVGRSGAGKSTLGGLLGGLYHPQSGQILINGQYICHFNVKALRPAIALVRDNYELFEGTIEENILLGLPQEDLPPGALEWAVRMVMLTDDLEQYPNRLQHQVTTAGTNISLGQRRRILMARAIVQQPKLLILDDAFTGMDTVTKRAILDNLFAPENDWTILNISHDSDIVQRTDDVYVLASGNLIESGSPRALARNRDSAFVQLFPQLV